jgi:hypothetical protein
MMTAEFQFDDKGKVRAKQSPAVTPQADPGRVNQPAPGVKPDAATLTQMQRTMGNTAVQRFLAQRAGSGPTELDDETASAIDSRRGAGHSLDEGMAGKAGSVMGQDFSGVKVHTDSTADNLSRDLGAKAFTTGNDIFFRSGQYDPASSSGQQLISHELTHVVQQGASVPALQGKMTVNDPHDQYEAEADAVAAKVMSKEDDAAVQRHDDEVQMQEEEELQMQEEEEELQMQEEEEELQMQEEEEELQMQEEEEMLQGKRA